MRNMNQDEPGQIFSQIFVSLEIQKNRTNFIHLPDKRHKDFIEFVLPEKANSKRDSSITAGCTHMRNSHNIE